MLKALCDIILHLTLIILLTSVCIVSCCRSGPADEDHSRVGPECLTALSVAKAQSNSLVRVTFSAATCLWPWS